MKGHQNCLRWLMFCTVSDIGLLLVVSDSKINEWHELCLAKKNVETKDTENIV